MKIALILDPLDELKPQKDTSIAVMREASRRGHAIFALEQQDIRLIGNRIVFHAQPLKISDGEDWYAAEPKTAMAPETFDAVLMRKDPPFDMEYVYSTYLLELAEKQGARVLNRPQAIRDFNEKLSVARFPQFAPEFIVTREMALIREFLAQHGDIVVKPLDGMGGSGIFRLHSEDHNIGVILETITHHERRTVMAQRYLPAIKQGDKRILLINGEPLPYALARIPKAGETRGNLAAGGTGVAQPLSARDREIGEAVGAQLKPLGLFLVGLDVIGEHLTEINVTSPTCMVEIAAQTDCRPAALFVDALEREAA
ncbi:glutathione synthase [Novimethylophilus kurashikiensis]|uniref:Glutathione synthetase n=1 Tax=Novimethylophilus kurashikiensis TaxID=1825523 RepID=A0A2R5F745_9PROT|nr:glutathione synthase [Novimethylophilus kurashikiensis]GBG13875.1 glutathione synthase [Novimethylophilus kurashikiensis]